MLHEALRLIRTLHDLNSTDLAAKLKISRSYFSEIEGGTKDASKKILDQYSSIFQISVQSILALAAKLENTKLPLHSDMRLKRKLMLSFLKSCELAGE